MMLFSNRVFTFLICLIIESNGILVAGIGIFVVVRNSNNSHIINGPVPLMHLETIHIAGAIESMLECDNRAALQVIFVVEGIFDTFVILLTRITVSEISLICLWCKRIAVVCLRCKYLSSVYGVKLCHLFIV